MSGNVNPIWNLNSRLPQRNHRSHQTSASNLINSGISHQSTDNNTAENTDTLSLSLLTILCVL